MKKQYKQGDRIMVEATVEAVQEHGYYLLDVNPRHGALISIPQDAEGIRDFIPPPRPAAAVELYKQLQKYGNEFLTVYLDGSQSVLPSVFNALKAEINRAQAEGDVAAAYGFGSHVIPLHKYNNPNGGTDLSKVLDHLRGRAYSIIVTDGGHVPVASEAYNSDRIMWALLLDNHNDPLIPQHLKETQNYVLLGKP